VHRELAYPFHRPTAGNDAVTPPEDGRGGKQKEGLQQTKASATAFSAPPAPLPRDACT